MSVEHAINGSSTAAQRQAIVLAGQRLGMDLDEVRGLTPAGSLRALSVQEASDLLDSLNRGRPERKRRARRCPAGILRLITPAQRHRIEALGLQLGYDGERLDGLLQRSFGLTLATLAGRRDASRVIALLQKIAEETEAKELRRYRPAMIDRLIDAARVERVAPPVESVRRLSAMDKLEAAAGLMPL